MPHLALVRWPSYNIPPPYLISPWPDRRRPEGIELDWISVALGQGSRIPAVPVGIESNRNTPAPARIYRAEALRTSLGWPINTVELRDHASNAAEPPQDPARIPPNWDRVERRAPTH